MICIQVVLIDGIEDGGKGIARHQGHNMARRGAHLRTQYYQNGNTGCPCSKMVCEIKQIIDGVGNKKAGADALS